MSDINTKSNFREDSRKDPATLEREIDQTRANMDQTLGQLERKFSPGQLLDQAMSFAKEHGGDFATNLSQSVRENPMPALLTAVGIAWMVASSNRPKPSGVYAYGDDPYKRRFDNRADFDDTADDNGFDESGNDQGVLAQAGQKVKAVAESARHKLASSQEKLAGSRGAVESGMRKTSDTAQVQAQRVREGFNTLLTQQPLVLGALGIAVGALIGAALPATEQEDRLLGPVRDKTISEVKERGAESYNQVRESVTRVGEEAKQAIAQVSGSKPAPEDRSFQVSDGK